ncbi:MAG: DUF3618 domain-containing protein [Candidatus Cybelea sp.]
MSQDPEIIRQNIAETQTQIGETAEALAYKTDLPSRARDAVNQRVDAIRGQVSDAFASVTDVAASAKETVGSAVAGIPSAGAGLRSIRSAAARNPLGLAIGSIAAGFLVGLCLPVSAVERERVGRLGERMTAQAKSAAVDAIEEGTAAVTHAIGDALSSTLPPA